MAAVVYMLCAATSLTCAGLLFVAYRRSRTTLLWGSCLCFLGLGLNNILLWIDLSVYPHVDISMVRPVPAVVGLMVLLYAMIWDVS